MATRTYTIRAAGTPHWRVYLIPLFVLLSAAVLSVLLYRGFEQALEVLAPGLVSVCVVAVVAGIIHLRVSRRRRDRLIGNRARIETVVWELAAGECPDGAREIGRSWQVMDIARNAADLRPAREQEQVRSGLRECGADQLVAHRAEKAVRKWERVRALQDLGWLGAVRTLPIVYRALSDPDDDIAWSALVALGGMDDDVAREVLLELLDDGRFAASRVAQVLDTSRHPHAVSVLHERVHTDNNSSLFWIAYLLGRSGSAGALAPLLKLTDHNSPNVRASAAEALGRLGDRSAIATLIRMTLDDAWFVRLHACRSLGDLDARNEIGVLEAATHDGSWWVRRSAADSLRRLLPVAA
ncbi:MAG: HEAT repeat domain-containing protein [Gemmatimonadota bacterium]